MNNPGPRKRSKRRIFSAEFKQEAVRLMEARTAEGVGIGEIARDLGVTRDQLRLWAKQFGQATPGGSTRSDLEAELRRVRRELETTRQERDFLKKAAAFFAKESR